MFLLIPVQNIKLQLNVSVCLLVKEVEVFRKTAEFNVSEFYVFQPCVWRNDLLAPPKVRLLSRTCTKFVKVYGSVKLDCQRMTSERTSLSLFR